MSDLKRYMHAVKRPVAMVLLGSAMVFSLQGCFGVIAGGVVAGTLAATDRRTLGAQTEDKSIAVKGEIAIPKVVGDAGHVNVTSFNRKVLLTGEVPSEAAKEAAAREASRIEGVQSVVNELAVSGASGFGSRSNDTLITGKVKASIVDNRTLYANSIKVVTERGIVYLMGRVTEREGDLAANIARGVSGVQKVVKVFEYISDEEYRMLSTTPESQPAQKQ
ncbi:MULTISPECIES: BON domain-containing protein [Oxalobacteraceae]|uniref:BON domain-containing protein n=1 Tax=Herminiimonas sp. Marseille-P9896 TaxID=2742211 RepID=UPI00158EFC74|nr:MULTISPECIES: BON domain-containing protein [Oxalobacteraceae]